MSQEKIIAVDFDGTLCENKWPEIGDPNIALIGYLKKRQIDGAKLILWTSRNEEQTRQAVGWCKEHGLTFDAVNDNLPEIIEKFGCNSRKILADEYIDDRNRLVESCREKSKMELWAEREVELACKKNVSDANAEGYEWEYGSACLKGALKAFKSICNDGYSGFGINIIKFILNRLIDGEPLTPVEDKEDEWTDVTSYGLGNDSSKCYQHNRMSSLFKYVFSDGTVKFQDIYRSIIINRKTKLEYSCGFITRIIDGMLPIEMPYMRAEPFKIYTENYLTNPANGDYDTLGILYAVDSNGGRIGIDRYFKEIEGCLVEIDRLEYEERKKMDQNREFLEGVDEQARFY